MARLLICLLVHPLVLEAAEAIGRAGAAEDVALQLKNGDITLAQAEGTTIENSLMSFSTKQARYSLLCLFLSVLLAWLVSRLLATKTCAAPSFSSSLP